MNGVILALLAPALLAAAPVPLVVGAVRDQTGVPVAGARVRAISHPADATTTQPDGTFALSAGGVTAVEITCRFCRPQRFSVGADGTVVAVVHRYVALLSNVPSADDLASLPYAHVESALALTPFTLFENSSAPLPGPELADRGAARDGLVVDGGIPNYDVAASISPFYTVPQRYVSSADLAGVADGWRYGDRANGGTAAITPFDGATAAAQAFGGNDGSARYLVSDGPDAVAAGLSLDGAESRRRADAQWQVPLKDALFSFGAQAASSDIAPVSGATVNLGYEGARIAFERARDLGVRVDAFVNRGEYGGNSYPASLYSAWSDAGSDVTISGLGAVRPFATVSFRNESGIYDDAAVAPRLAATSTQTRGLFGADASGARLAASGGLAIESAAYSGGTLGVSHPGVAQFAAPSAQMSWRASDRFRLDASDGGGYRLPTILERYALPVSGSGIDLDRDATREATLTYDDGARVRASLTGLNRRTVGFDDERIATLGASLAWQATPALSLRSWWMRANVDEHAERVIVRYGAMPQTTNTGAAWLTYQAESGVRVDAIVRTDYIDYLYDTHVDASISGPLRRHVRWYAGTERYQRVRYLNAGIRFER